MLGLLGASAELVRVRASRETGPDLTWQWTGSRRVRRARGRL